MSDDLLTGIEEIDREHKQLFDCLSRVRRAVSDEERWSAVHFALDELADFARMHFAVEEALLRLHDYPLLRAHIAEHRAFSARLAELHEKSLRSDVCEEIVAFMKNWLVEHIGKSDHQYVPYLRTAPVAVACQGG